MDRERLFYLGAGPLAAILLGMALVPLRGLTPASNRSFAFMALTIVVAEFGGRWAAIATALVSALSLDFFLTQPYVRLSIEDNHDIIAFLGLTVCGLIAAALGSQRSERIAALRSVAFDRPVAASLLSALTATAWTVLLLLAAAETLAPRLRFRGPDAGAAGVDGVRLTWLGRDRPGG